MTMLLAGRVAIVSGIGPGMGRDISLAFAREGAHLVLGARTEQRLAEVAGEVEALGRKVTWARCDITSEDDCNALAAAAIETFGRIDVLVNNAFVQPPLQTLEDTDLETWREAFDVNLLGSVRMTRAVITQMKAQRSGSIVFIGSMSARRIRRKFGVYAAMKSGLMATAQTLARELGPSGVRVNTVLPGYIWGPSLEWFFGYLADKQGRTPQDVYDEIAAETCLQHIPTSAEIADAVLFFASDLSRVVTGQSLDVNAGHWFA
jgi:NAD(P)-dependent dehydrogenase (short-subunit alcohol dehydrogenase family)